MHFGASRLSSLIESLSPYQICRVALQTLLSPPGAKRAVVPQVALAAVACRGRGAFDGADPARRRLAHRAAHAPRPSWAGGAGLAPGPPGPAAGQARRAPRGRRLVAGVRLPGRAR